MKVIDLDTKQEQVVIKIDDQELGFALTTHKTGSEQERYVAVLHAMGFEAAADDESRGAAMLYLSRVLKALGYKLAMMAFEQEGAVHMPPERERRLASVKEVADQACTACGEHHKLSEFKPGTRVRTKVDKSRGGGGDPIEAGAVCIVREWSQYNGPLYYRVHLARFPLHRQSYYPCQLEVAP